LEYYKDLFFSKKKHSYELHKINLLLNDEGSVKYDNVPVKGFKLINLKFLDPITGYIFHPHNAYAFKEKLIKTNQLVNGVCTAETIFEYVKDGSFNIHFYDDVKDTLLPVEISKKISLSNSKIGMLLRNIDDEEYYIYLGLVGQYYVSDTNNGMVKKKHMVLKTNYITNSNSFEDTSIYLSHISYLDFTKDKDENYFKIMDVDLSKLKIALSMYDSDCIMLVNYIENDIFDVDKFSKDYPHLVLSRTIRKVFSKNYISMTRNKIKLVYEYVTKSSLELYIDFEYKSFDSKFNKFNKVTLMPTFILGNGKKLDIENKNYAIKVGNDHYLLTLRTLSEMQHYGAKYKKNINICSNGNYNMMDVFFFSLSDVSFQNNNSSYLNFLLKEKSDELNWTQEYEIYEINYELNKTHLFSIFDNPYSSLHHDTFHSTKELFTHIKNDKSLTIPIFGGVK